MTEGTTMTDLNELSAAAWNKWHSNTETHYAKKHMEMAFLAGFEAAYRTGQLVERAEVDAFIFQWFNERHPAQMARCLSEHADLEFSANGSATDAD